MNYINLQIILFFVIIPDSLFLDENIKKTIYESKYISLPFKQKNPYYRRYPSNYSSTNFINDFFTNNLLVDMNLGSPIQIINSVLKPSSSCFSFIEKMKGNDNNKNEISKYIPKKSLTFLLNKNSRDMIAEDLFLLKDKNNKNIFNNIHIPFSLDLDLGEINEETELICELGLNSKFGLNDKNCPNFMNELKKNKNIKEKVFSLVYKYKTEGYIFIGNSLYNIDEDKYNKNNFFKVNVIRDKNSIKWNINFDKIYIHDSYLEGNRTLSNKTNNGKIYLNTKQVNIKIDQKIIIGTLEYKKMIDNLYFNKLIKSNICKYEIIPFNSRNYYIYSCTALLFATFEPAYSFEDDSYQEPIYHYLHFPSLIFQSETLKYSFELKYDELFQLLGERFYFMVVFDSDEENGNSYEWTIGEQFIKKHIFSFNIDRQSILFYNEKQFNDKFEENDLFDETIKYDKLEKKDNKNIFIIIVIAASIFLPIISFYLGIKIKEKRKKRANELRDEYEYFSNNVSINSKDSDKNRISKNGKCIKEIELNIPYLK